MAVNSKSEVRKYSQEHIQNQSFDDTYQVTAVELLAEDQSTTPDSLTRLQADSSGNLKVNVAAGGAGDGSILDGVSSSIKATVKDLSNSNPLTVAIVDGAGDQITSFGGGTQYTEGDTDATITGTAVMVEDAANTLRAVPGDATKGMKVQITDGTGTQITSFGGGTQYDDSATDATPTGTMAMVFEAATNTLYGVRQPAAGDNSTGTGMVSSTIYGQFDDTSPTAISENRYGTLRMSSNRNLYSTIRDAAGNERGLNIDANGAIGVTNAGITTIAGAVSGTEMQVDVLTMPTVTVNSHAVTNAGTFAVQVDGAALTSLQLADDVVATLGTTTYSEATTKGTIVGAVRRDADTTLVDTTNEIGPLQMDANGRLKVEAFSGETLPVSLTSTTITGTVAVTQSGTWDEVGINDSGNSITVDGTVTANLAAGTNNIGDVDILSIAAGDNNIGNVDVVTVPADPFGANADAAATAGSTGSMQAKFRLMTSQLDAIKTSVETIDNTVGGSELQVDVVGSLPAGTNAIGKLAANSGVDIGDVDVTSLSHGKTLVSAGGSAASSGDNTIVAAGTNKLKVYAFSLSTTSTTAVTCIFKSGAGGTELWRVTLQAPSGANTGANLAVSPPAWLFATGSATLLNLNLSAAQTVHWSVSYFDEA